RQRTSTDWSLAVWNVTGSHDSQPFIEPSITAPPRAGVKRANFAPPGPPRIERAISGGLAICDAVIVTLRCTVVSGRTGFSFNDHPSASYSSCVYLPIPK